MLSSSSTTSTFFFISTPSGPSESIAYRRPASGLFLRPGEAQGEDGAPGFLVAELDLPAMGGDDPVRDGQPQARAAHLGRVVGIEEVGHGLGRDAVARIVDIDDHLAGL